MKITIPDIGDFDAVEVIEVLVSAGDELELEQAIIVLESDKATMEVPAPAAGKLLQLSIVVGDKVSQGDVIGELQERPVEVPESASKLEPPASEFKDVKPTSAPASAPKAPAAPASAPSPSPGLDSAEAETETPHASPSVRLFARELGVKLHKVKGSGPKGRILKQDVQGFVKSAMQSGAAGSATTALPRMPEIDFGKFGETEIQPLARIRKLSAANLHRNWLIVPHVTQFEKADITDLEAFRKAENKRGEVKLTLLPFIMKAVALGLKAYPEFNSSLSADGESLILKKYCNIGFAADTPRGLVVPVIRDVPVKSVSHLAEECAQLAAKAREGKLGPSDMQGGCFSISSLGGIGGTHFTPIINAPEVAILGVSRAQVEPCWDGERFQPRTMITMSLSYDHRVIDGAAAARMAVTLAELLADIRRLCM